MKIVDIFDAVGEGTFEEFRAFYQDDINIVNEYTKLNLLQTAMINDHNAEEKIKMIDFLLSEGIDINYVESQENMNALHILYSSVTNGTKEYLYNVSRKLIERGIDVNQKNKYGAIPLSYLIATCRLDTEDLEELFLCLLEAGSDYLLKDNFGKSCIDYANDFSWRNGFIDIVKEIKDDK